MKPCSTHSKNEVDNDSGGGGSSSSEGSRVEGHGDGDGGDSGDDESGPLQRQPHTKSSGKSVAKGASLVVQLRRKNAFVALLAHALVERRGFVGFCQFMELNARDLQALVISDEGVDDEFSALVRGRSE